MTAQATIVMELLLWEVVCGEDFQPTRCLRLTNRVVKARAGAYSARSRREAIP
jgi:hypothetical protein